jgi:hypothetical protein
LLESIHFISAEFQGDQNFDSSESEGNFTVDKANTRLESSGNGLNGSLGFQIWLVPGNSLYKNNSNTLTLSINGNTYTEVTDSRGVIDVCIPTGKCWYHNLPDQRAPTGVSVNATNMTFTWPVVTPARRYDHYLSIRFGSAGCTENRTGDLTFSWSNCNL